VACFGRIGFVPKSIPDSFTEMGKWISSRADRRCPGPLASAHTAEVPQVMSWNVPTP